jgi:Arc/MetJ family transcription regulator
VTGSAAVPGRLTLRVTATIISGPTLGRRQVLIALAAARLEALALGRPSWIGFLQNIAIWYSLIRYPVLMRQAIRKKTSFEIDPAKVEAAKEILGTRTLTETVDSALAEVVKARQRRDLVEILFQPGALTLDDPEAMIDAWR